VIVERHEGGGVKIVVNAIGVEAGGGGGGAATVVGTEVVIEGAAAATVLDC